MLYNIGLFRGTEKGFELDKPMTRAEAAAMLTRLLGAEKTAFSRHMEAPVHRRSAMGGQVCRLALSEWADQRYFRNEIRRRGKSDL